MKKVFVLPVMSGASKRAAVPRPSTEPSVEPANVVTTPAGPVAPGGPEARIDALEAVLRSAIVGVGPQGTQAVVAVVEAAGNPGGGRIRPGLAPTGLAAAVREAALPVPVAAVLITVRVPVDIRHNSKVDRTRLARWADGVLAGGRVRSP